MTMDVFGDRKWLRIAGDSIHELPPLLLKNVESAGSIDNVVGIAQDIVEDDALVPGEFEEDPKLARTMEQRRVGLAVNLAEQYVSFLSHWVWGESILEWIRQCEITFQTKAVLRPLLAPDVWPHASRASFVTLLEDKRVPHRGVDLENAMGFRLTFRQPPPIHFFSDKFLFFLNSSIAANAYQKWAGASGEGIASLPPERFRFFVTGTDIREV